MHFFLATNVLALVLQVLAIILTAYVLCLLYRIKKDTISACLILFLTATEFIHATAISFYTVYLMKEWSPTQVDMNPHIVIISSVPLTFQLKVNLVLTTAIALDRVLALYVPLQYRLNSSPKLASVALVSAVLSGFSDIVLVFLFTPMVQKINCGAVGCFISPQFRSYFGTSNMVLGLLAIVLTIVVFFKLQRMQVQSRRSRFTRSSESLRLTKANQTSVIFLLSSLCLTIPSVIIGGTQIFGISLFEHIGPFYLVGLLCASCMNCIVYVLFNSSASKRVENMDT